MPKKTDKHHYESTSGNVDVEVVDVGVSARALSIARAIDRLEPGEYCIIFTKEQVAPWHAVVSKMDRLRVMNISKR